MIGEVIVFPEVEAVAIGYLVDEMTAREDTAHVSDELPSPDLPNRVVKVQSGGPGGDVNLTTSRRSVIVQCWDTDRVAAANLAESCFGLMKALQGNQTRGAFVRKVTAVGAPVYFPDPLTELPRYQFTVSLDLAGRAL